MYMLKYLFYQYVTKHVIRVIPCTHRVHHLYATLTLSNYLAFTIYKNTDFYHWWLCRQLRSTFLQATIALSTTKAKFMAISKA